MAQPRPSDRLQPALLDLLTDDQPEQRVESHHERALTLRQLRQLVLRDLEWLFNCGALARDDGQPLSPLVAASVVNYGIPSLAGAQSSGLDLQRLEQLLRDAIVAFEPRLLRQSVRVRAVQQSDVGEKTVAFEVSAQLWAQPIPIELFLRTELDLETGHVAIQAEEGRG